MRRRFGTVAVLLAVALGGCAGETPSAPASASVEQSVPTVASSSADAASQPPSADATTGGEGCGEGTLVSRLPGAVDGIGLSYESADGLDSFGDEGVSPEAADALDRMGAAPEDVSYAYGFAFDQAGRVVSISAFCVDGADEEAWRAEFRRSFEQDGDVVEEATVGGKDVFSVPFEEGEEGATYVYASGDSVYVISALPAELAGQALATLP